MRKSIRTILMDKHAKVQKLLSKAKSHTERARYQGEANGIVIALLALRDAGINVDFALLEEENTLT